MTALVLLLAAADIDLTRATIVTQATLSTPERKAVEMLRDEVERRAGVRWAQAVARAAAGPVISVGQSSSAPSAAESFRNQAAGGSVSVEGRDARGVLFGVGHLLRNLDMRRGRVTIDAAYSMATSPETALRGHQLGYRPKTNSYDAWTLPMWEQYIRDLAVFGTNAIELIPPRSDDDADSPHFPKPPMEMMIGMSKTADDYGLDVWIWYPALDTDYADSKTVEFALNEWGDVFRQLPRVDAVLVPAGDPGHTPAWVLMPMLEKQAANLRRYHPKAQLWLAPQGFDAENLEHFFEIVKREPAWLAGIVYGPQTRMPLDELRRRLPARYPIRHYPDITHTRSSQYPVPDWDAAFAVTLGREPINPRPVDQAIIYRRLRQYTIGFITYSEGCNDDVNKLVWSGLGWKHDTPVVDILRDYSRYFIGPDVVDGFAQGLLALERNWRGPALTNTGIRTTLSQFQSMERSAAPARKANWRFQQALYRAYYDAYVQSRLIAETAAEDAAIAALRAGSLAKAEALLEPAPVAPDLRARIFELAEALYQSVRMQLSVARYQGMAGRGTNLDAVDAPLNSRRWLAREFASIRAMASESDRAARIDRIVSWTNPGPGGFYDDLGNPAAQPHLVAGSSYADDPQYFRAPLAFFDTPAAGRKSWWDQAMTLYEQPLRMEYRDLDRTARYKIRAVYGAGPIRLSANGAEVHGYLTKPYEVLEFPLRAPVDGKLALEWSRSPGGGGAGRGSQVAEVWLIKE